MRFYLLLLLLLLVPGLPAWAAPNAPSGVTANATAYNTIALAWTDNSNNEAGFEISQRIPPATAFTPLGTVAPNTIGVNIINRTSGVTYEYVVIAYDAANADSPFSNIATATTPLTVLSTNFRAAYPGTPFSFNLTSSNPALVTNYAVSALPEGLSLNPTTGQITGIPTGTGGKTTGTVTITHTGGRTATAPLTIRLFVAPPALAAPVLAGPAPGAQILSAGTTPAPIPIGGLFIDPDVASAARLTTDLGNLDFAFYPGSAPQTVANFMGYMNRGDFNNTIFHRSISSFIIQAGAFRADATASAAPTQPPVINEPNITNLRGTIAMAKVGGNPDSATNQFFINLGNNAANLDNQNEGFTVFARVAGNGMALADAVAALPTRNYSSINGALTDAPVRGTPPASYDPATLMRISQAAPVAPLTFSAASSDPAIAGVSLTGTDLTLSPGARGTATITLTATDLDHQSTHTTFEVTVRDGYDRWAAGQSFPLPADALPTADPDRDGTPNLLEYAFGTLPLTPGPPAPLQLDFRGEMAQFLIRAFPSHPIPADLSWNAEFSDLPDFSNSILAPATVISDLPPPTTTVSLEFYDPGTPSGPRRFGRLKVTRP